ncbi:hypothetical protein EDD18DRAFT_1098723 [Armillaria luteobubalina]|uniref:Uncharacterized protein n=1 Tax=Armillaria luteobubalina TaxID=153913 RepID=A0AA39QNU8_9AGAR|nr:hypothetical protein EDD18DRAFT_1098723 [Armillaria luteobubalina]
MPKYTYERAELDGTTPIVVGATIYSRATKLYSLTPTDLQSISPVRQERNLRGGWVTYHNTRDIERLQRGLQGRSATGKKTSGPKTTKIDALNIFSAVAKRVYGPSYKSPATQSRRRYPPAAQGRYDGL